MTARLRPYPAYKDSGLPWLGKIPEHWFLKRAKYLYREVDERSTTGEEELLSVSHLTGVTPRREKNVTMFLAESNVGHKLCRPGDLVINTMWAWMAALGVSSYEGLVSPSYGVYRPLSNGLLPGYADRLHRTSLYAAEYTRCSTGVNSSRLRLYPEEFLRIPIVVPPMADQVAVNKYLSHLDRSITRYLRVKQHLLRLLDEQRQSIIKTTITRGYLPNVSLKTSGAQWMDRIPEHWDLKRLKWVTRLQRGYDLPADQREPGPHPVVSSGGVIDTHSEPRCGAPGVVMGRYGSTDAVFYIEQAFWPHNTSLFVTNFFGNDPRWSYYLLSSITKADNSGKSAVPGIDRKDLFQIVVPVPPLAEQVEIAARIDSSTRCIADATSSVKRDIALACEYRSRLVRDIVTGQLDVREAAANLPDEPDEPSVTDEILEEVDEADLEMDDSAEEVA